MKYQFTDNELKKLLQSIVVLVDTREKRNGHITTYFDKHEIHHKPKKLDYGDYSLMLPSCREMGVFRDIYFTDTIAIERKASLEELSGNLTRDRARFETELIRANACKLFLMVENANYADIVAHRYKTQYEPKSFLASLKTYEARYLIDLNFVPASFAGNFIYHTLYYHVREYLLKGVGCTASIGA